jgi:hypothetical protein
VGAALLAGLGDPGPDPLPQDVSLERISRTFDDARS